MSVQVNSILAATLFKQRVRNPVRFSTGIPIVASGYTSGGMRPYDGNATVPTSFSINQWNVIPSQDAVCNPIMNSDDRYIRGRYATSGMDATFGIYGVNGFGTSLVYTGTVSLSGIPSLANQAYDFAVDSNDVLHAIFTDSVTTMGTAYITLYYSTYSSGTWSTPVELYGVSASSNFAFSGTGPSIQIDSDNIPVIGMSQGSSNGWLIGNQNIATSFTFTSVSTWLPQYQTLGVDTRGDHYLFGLDSTDLKIVKHEYGDAWSTHTQTTISNKDYDTLYGVRILGDKAFVIFKDNTNNGSGISITELDISGTTPTVTTTEELTDDDWKELGDNMKTNPLYYNYDASGVDNGVSDNGQAIDLCFNQESNGYPYWVTYETTTSSTYTLTSNKGSLSLGGKVTSLEYDRILNSSKRSLSLSGKVTTLSYGSSVLVNKGSLLLDGKNADFSRDRTLGSQKLSLSLSGKNIDFTYLVFYTVPTSKGSFSLNGKNLDFLRVINYNVPLSKGTFIFTGKDANLTSDLILSSNKGSLLLDGKEVTLDYVVSYILSSSKVSFVLNGKVATLEYVVSYTLDASVGSFLLNGKVTTLDYVKVYDLSASKGSFSLDGKSVTFTYIDNRVLSLSKGSFSLDGKVVSFNFVDNSTLPATKGSFSLDGKSVTFTYVDNRVLSLSKGSFSLDGKTAIFDHLEKLVMASIKGSFLLDGKVANLTFVAGYNLLTSKGSFSLDGKTATLDHVEKLVMSSEKGSVILDGKVVSFNFVDNSTLPATKGSFLLDGKVANFTETVAYNMTSSKGSFVLAGKTASFNFVDNSTLPATKGSLTLEGKTALLNYISASVMSSDKGSFLLDGKVTTLGYAVAYDLVTSKGSFLLDGKVLTIERPRTLEATLGSFNIINKAIYSPPTERTLTFNGKRILFNTKTLTYNGT